MSLINDALKRAKESQQKNPPPSGAPPLAPFRGESRVVMGWHLPALIILLIVAACIFIGLAMLGRSGKKVEAAPKISSPAVVVSNPPPVEIKTIAPPISNSTAAVPAPLVKLKLQGIVFDSKRPWAIVDDETVFVGDRVSDLLVMEISKNTVTLQRRDGSLEKLGLGK